VTRSSHELAPANSGPIADYYASLPHLHVPTSQHHRLYINIDIYVYTTVSIRFTRALVTNPFADSGVSGGLRSCAGIFWKGLSCCVVRRRRVPLFADGPLDARSAAKAKGLGGWITTVTGAATMGIMAVMRGEVDQTGETPPILALRTFAGCKTDEHRADHDENSRLKGQARVT